MMICGRKPAAGVLGTLLLLAVVSARPAAALEVEWTGRAGAVASDNIDRGQRGTEEEGYLLTLGAMVDVLEKKGRGSMHLLMYGGQENRKAETSLSGEVYRLLLEAALPWTDTGTINMSVETSQQTETPEATDILQTRSVANRSRADLLLGQQGSPRTNWQVRLGAREDLRNEREATEWTSGLSWSRDMTRTFSLALDGGTGRGEDDIDGSSWQHSNASFEMTRRHQQPGSSGLRLEWEASDVQEADGSETGAVRISAGFFYNVQGRTGWSHRGDLGLDSVRPTEGEDAVEPRVNLAEDSPTGRRTQTSLGLSYASRLQDPEQVQASWVSEGRFMASLRWDLSRKFAITPSVSFLRADYYGEGMDDRVDETSTGRLGLTWHPSPSWTTVLVVHAESRDSTEDAFILEEGRIELTISARFI